MSIYIGNTKIGQMYLGSTEIAEAYLGSTKVYDKGGLPYDAQVEYLESSGTQYIDTGIVPNDETGFYIRAYCKTSGGNHVCFGARGNSSTDSRCWINFSTAIEFSWNTWISSGVSNYTNTWVEIEHNLFNSRTGKLDGVVKRSDYPTLASIAYNLYLFASNTVGTTSLQFTGRISSFKISQGSDVVMDMIPVRKKSVGYMYDQVSGQLFGNAGGGSFTLGNDVS